jgi:translation initiation factor 1
MAFSDWKDRLGVVYSTSDGFDYQTSHQEKDIQTLAPKKQRLFVGIDRRHRAGKQVTVVSGFQGTTEDLEQLGKVLKNKCGTGGAVKEGQILIQGDFRERVVMMLQNIGYQAKRSN